MFNKRKAQGLSITTIIVAVIALIVLVVLIAVFTGRFGIFSKGLGEIGDITKKCTEQGGSLEESCAIGEDEITSSDSIAESQKCCKTPQSSPSGDQDGTPNGGGSPYDVD